MNASRIALLLFATALLAPIGSAADVDLEKETDTVLEVPVCGPTGATCSPADAKLGVQVYARLDLRVSNASGWAANSQWTLWVPVAAAEPRVEVSRNEFKQDLSPDRVNASGAAQDGLQLWSIDLAGALPSVGDGDVVSIQAFYTMSGTTYRHRVARDVPALLVFLGPASGNRPTLTNMPAVVAADDRYHSVRGATTAGFEYTVGFTEAPAPPGSIRNLNTQAWTLGGLVVGFLIAFWAAKRGWITGARAKRFEKGGAIESKAMLEARRRTLMAALKELEVAHEAKEVPDSAYAPLKEEYKAQTVRVMRTLDDKKEPPTGGG